MKGYMILLALCLTLSLQAQDIGTASSNYMRSDVPEQLLKQARLLYNEKSYDLAEDFLLTLMKEDISDAQKREVATMLTCIAYYRDPVSAGELIDKYLSDYPDAPEINRMKSLAMMSDYAQGNFAEVIGAMGDIDPDLLSDEERDYVILIYALSLIEEERYDEAVAQLTILDVISDRYDMEVCFYTAYADMVAKRYDEAEAGFLQTKGVADFSRQSHYYLAEIALASREYVEAEQLAVAYLEEYTEDEWILEMKRIQGEALYGQERYLSAAVVLEEYLSEIEDPKREALYQLGMSHFNTNEHLRAPEIFSMVTHGDDVIAQSAQLHAGLSFLALDDKNKARLCFEQAAAMTASSQLREKAMYNYTVCVHETSYVGFGESVAILERFLNEFPNSVYADRVNSYLVETYMSTKNYDAALISIAKINNPSSVVLEAKQKLLYRAGTEAFANGNPDVAIVKFNESLEVGKYDRQTKANAFFWRGEAFYRKSNFRQAAKDYTAYLTHTNERQARTYALALYGLGYAYFVQKQYQEAFKQFNVLLKSNLASSGVVDKTTLADAQMRVGDCYFQSRQYSAAEDAYGKAVGMEPSSADYALYQKAFAQGLTGRYTEKIGTLTYLIENYPQSDYLDDALYEKGRAYVQLDNGNQAISVFDQLVDQYPHSQYAPKAGNEIALIYYQNNELRLAIKAYKRVITSYPGSEQADVAMRDLKNLYVEENMVDSYIEFASQTKGMAKVEINEHDSLTYKAAELTYTRGDEKKAIEAFTKYLSQFTNGAYVVDAQYYLGSIYCRQNNYDEALKYLQYVVTNKNSKYYEESVRMIADMSYNHKDYDIAIDAYEDLIVATNHPSTKLHAQTYLLRSAYALNRYELIIDRTEGVLANTHLAPETAEELRYYRAKSYLAKSKDDKAIVDLKSLSSDTRNVYGAEAKYLLAQLYYNISQFDNAEKEVLDYISVSTPHSYWLARSFILLSDVYMKKEMKIEAKQYLLSLKNSYQADDDIAMMIEERLKVLESSVNNQ